LVGKNHDTSRLPRLSHPLDQGKPGAPRPVQFDVGFGGAAGVGQRDVVGAFTGQPLGQRLDLREG